MQDEILEKNVLSILHFVPVARTQEDRVPWFAFSGVPYTLRVRAGSSFVSYEVLPPLGAREDSCVSFQHCPTHSLQGCPLLPWASGRNSVGQVAPMGTAAVLQLAGMASHGMTDLHLCHVPAVRATCFQSNGFNHPYTIGSQGSLWGVSDCCSFGIILGSCHDLKDKGSLWRVFHPPATSVLQCH